MRDIRNRRTVRGTVVALGALVAFGAPTAAFAADQPAGADQNVSASGASVQKQRKLVKTQRLVDGSVGKVYKVGGHFEADIFYKGKKIGTLNTRTTVLKHHGVNYSFHPYKGILFAERAGKTTPNKDDRPGPDGPIKPIPNPTPDDGITDPIPNPTPDDGITDPIPNPNPGIGDSRPADVAGAAAGAERGVSPSAVAVMQQGKPVKKLVRVTGLVDGSVAKVYKAGKGYSAEITSKGSRVGTIKGRGEITYGETGGLGVVHAKLSPNGKITSWLTSPKPKPGASQDDQRQDDGRQDDQRQDDVVAPEPQPEGAGSIGE